jgi:hypothetical protein
MYHHATIVAHLVLVAAPVKALVLAKSVCCGCGCDVEVIRPIAVGEELLLDYVRRHTNRTHIYRLIFDYDYFYWP